MLTNHWRDAVAAGDVKAKTHAIDLFDEWLGEFQLKPDQILQLDYDRFLVSLSDKAYAPNTIHSVDAHLRILYRWSVVEGLIPQMPLANKAPFKMERKASALHPLDIEMVIDRLIELSGDDKRTPKMRLLDARRSAVAALHFYWGLGPAQIVTLPWAFLALDAAGTRPFGIELGDDDPASIRLRSAIARYRDLIGYGDPANGSQHAFFSRRKRQLALRAVDLGQDVRKGALEAAFAGFRAFTSQELLRAHHDHFRAADFVATASSTRSKHHDQTPTEVAPELIIDLVTLHPRHGL